MNKQLLITLFCTVFLMGCSGPMSKLGINNGGLTPCPGKPNCVSTETTDKKQFIEPIHFTGSSAEAQSRLLSLLKTMKRTNIVVTQDNYIRAEFTSLVFRFVDDIEFYFPSTDSEKIIMRIRSASRIGYYDFGANRKRIEQIRSKFKAN